jgi:hypothetical protein
MGSVNHTAGDQGTLADAGLIAINLLPFLAAACTCLAREPLTKGRFRLLAGLRGRTSNAREHFLRKFHRAPVRKTYSQHAKTTLERSESLLGAYLRLLRAEIR